MPAVNIDRLVHGAELEAHEYIQKRLFDVSWVFPLSVKESLLSWHGSFVGKRRKKAWMTALLCIFWKIW